MLLYKKLLLMTFGTILVKSNRLRWAGHAVRLDGNELPKRILWTNPGDQRGRSRPKSRWIEGGRGRRKENWVVEIGWRCPE